MGGQLICQAQAAGLVSKLDDSKMCLPIMRYDPLCSLFIARCYVLFHIICFIYPKYFLEQL